MVLELGCSLVERASRAIGERPFYAEMPPAIAAAIAAWYAESGRLMISAHPRKASRTVSSSSIS
jgi:hypothetical protein